MSLDTQGGGKARPRNVNDTITGKEEYNAKNIQIS